MTVWSTRGSPGPAWLPRATRRGGGQRRGQRLVAGVSGGLSASWPAPKGWRRSVLRGDRHLLPAHESQRVDLPAITDDFEMHVGSSGPPRRAHQRDRVTALDRLPHGHQRSLVVGIPGHIAVTVVDFHEVAITRAVTRPSHNTRSNRHNIGAGGTREIHTFVIRLFSGERIFTLTEVGGNES